MPPNMQFAHHEQHQSFNNLPRQSPQNARTSRPPPSSNNTDRLVAGVKVNHQLYDGYVSIPPSDSGARESYFTLQSRNDFQSRQILVQNPSHHQPENPIARFILEESSWDPLGGRQHGVLQLSLPEYSIYRNTATAPSEPDTIGPVTDSGYGSMPRQSVGIPSVCGDVDHSADTQSLIQGVSDFQFHHGLSPGQVSSSREEDSGRREWDSHDATTNLDANELFCKTCNSVVKTKSELKKHEQRHSKPHRCDLEKCPRNGDGFSTLNDLLRHKQTVHRVGGIKYRCTLEQCGNKKKDWPRADNFKQHLIRVHRVQPVDLEQYRSTSTPEPEKQPSRSPETKLPQQPTGAQINAVSQPDWTQIPVVNSAMNPKVGLEAVRLESGMSPSDRTLSLDGSSFGDMDETRYPTQIPFDGMGLSEKMDHLIPHFDTSGQHLLEVGSSPTGATHNGAHSCINPDILNHIGLRTSFPGEITGSQDIRSQVLELEPEGPAVFSQVEGETGIRTDEHSFLGSSHPVAGDLDLDDASASSDGDLDDSDSEDVAQPPSPRAMYKEEGVSRVESGEPKLEPHTAASTPESMSLDETYASALVEGLMKKQVLDDILQKLGYRMVKESDIKDLNSGSESQGNSCDRCKKSFSRPCELRKHRKRHEKPYACTYPRCDKRFGSKNDWKRHENSQHFQLECWKCNEPSSDSSDVDGICGKVCHRRETFANHLERDHGLDQNAIEGKWAACRVGRNCETRFWCGFCGVVVELESRGGLAWAERFNHIDEHFSGRNGKPKVDISKWKSVEPVLSEGHSGDKYLGNRGRPGENPRKRHRSRSGDGSPRTHRKKPKIDDGEVFWSCCTCNNVWNPATTGNTCMNCTHTQCQGCEIEAHTITEKVTPTLMMA